MSTMRIRHLLIAAVGLTFAGSAQAVTKAYDMSSNNGIPADFLNTATNLCPPTQTSPSIVQGNVSIEDDNLGTVTLNPPDIRITTFIDLGPDQLVVTFGPGAFIFIDSATSSFSTGAVSNTTGIGAHGPSGTDPGETAEWGVTSGWDQTGRQFCLSSPTDICNGAGFAHGATIFPTLPSNTYNLGTWNFDAAGDYSNESPYIQRTSNGGLQNSRYDMRGAFVGSALPALPLVGFGALALSLAVIGGRALVGKK